jgi:TnpA family transposase
VWILDGLLKNESDIKPEEVTGDLMWNPPSGSHKNTLYQAFRKLGRVVRTAFCCNISVIQNFERFFDGKRTQMNRLMTLPRGSPLATGA